MEAGCGRSGWDGVAGLPASSEACCGSLFTAEEGIHPGRAHAWCRASQGRPVFLAGAFPPFAGPTLCALRCAEPQMPFSGSCRQPTNCRRTENPARDTWRAHRRIPGSVSRLREAGSRWTMRSAPVLLVRCSEAAHATWREEPRFEGGGWKRDRPAPGCARPCSGRLSTAGVPRGGYASGSSSEVVGTSSRGSSAFFTGASNAGKSVRRDEEMGASPVVRAQAGAGP